MIRLCVFDAYGTLFDVDAAARESGIAPENWPRLSADWRRKQLEYTWLRSVAGAHVDFWQITQDALDWALEAQGLAAEGLRAELLALYRRLGVFGEVPQVLAQLCEQGMPLAILSNGSRPMLEEAVRAARLEGQFAALLSVDEVEVYKPARAVYDLVGQHFGTAPGEVLFVSANGWDICAGAAYGFRTLWLNRAGLPMDHLHGAPEAEMRSMQDLPRFIREL